MSKHTVDLNAFNGKTEMLYPMASSAGRSSNKRLSHVSVLWVEDGKRTGMDSFWRVEGGAVVSETGSLNKAIEIYNDLP